MAKVKYVGHAASVVVPSLDNLEFPNGVAVDVPDDCVDALCAGAFEKAGGYSAPAEGASQPEDDKEHE